MGRKHDKKEEAAIILEILNRIPLSKRFVSVDDILNSLASAEIDVSRRSLQRYLKQMYDCGKYGLVRDNRGNAYGYRRERTDSITDSIHLKPNECLLLRIAQEHMKYQIPGTVLKSLGFLFDAASEMLKEKGSNAKENQWLNKVCVISSSIPQMPSKVLPRIFDAVSEALYSEKKLRIEYTNMNGKTTSAVVSPLALVQQDVRLYLICQFDHFDNVVHLALHRFKKAEVTSFDAHRPEDFNLQSYIHDRHFNYSNGEWVHWILRCHRKESGRNALQHFSKTDSKRRRNLALRSRHPRLQNAGRLGRHVEERRPDNTQSKRIFRKRNGRRRGITKTGEFFSGLKRFSNLLRIANVRYGFIDLA